MKKILLTLVIVLSFTLPTFSEEKGLATLDFATQTGELIGQAKLCGINTMDVNQRFIEGITVLANYRQESAENAIKLYKSTIQKQLNSSASNYDCTQIKSDFAQVELQLQKNAQ